MLGKIDNELRALTSLSDVKKIKHMKKKKLSWKDVPDLALQRCKSQMVPGQIRWPPACSAKDGKAAPSTFGNLAQMPPPHGKSKSNQNGNGKSRGSWLNDKLDAEGEAYHKRKYGTDYAEEQYTAASSSSAGAKRQTAEQHHPMEVDAETAEETVDYSADKDETFEC